jgi:hypothetical protein
MRGRKPGGKTEHNVALKMDLHVLSMGEVISEDYHRGMTEDVLRKIPGQVQRHP